MRNTNRLSPSAARNLKSKFAEVDYIKPGVLHTKRDIHRRYSTKQIDLDDIVERAVLSQNAGTVLEVGCGSGQFLKRLQENSSLFNAPLVGLDIGRGIFLSTQERTAERTRKLFFVRGDIELLPLNAAFFDVVVAIHCLSHLPNLNQGLLEIRQVLSPNGVLIATANSIENYPHVREYRERIWKALNWTDVFFTTEMFSAETMRASLEPVFPCLDIHRHNGELALPLPAFLQYFLSNICTWSRTPSDEEIQFIVSEISQWAKTDVQGQGVVIESKSIAMAVCHVGDG